jgi:glycosyltransferase involved in cell wall biosynthesis
MIHLCIDVRMIHASGIGTCIQNLLPFLFTSPFKLSLLGQSTNSASQPSIPFNTPIYSLREQLYFPFKIPSCDLFWSPHYNVPFFPIKSKARVVTLHDVCHLAKPTSKAQWLAAKLLIHNACKKSQKIITQSYFSKSEILKYVNISEEQIEVIHPGVNFKEFFPLQNTEEFQNKYNLNFPFFLFVGNMKSHKNLSIALKAFEWLNPTDCHFVLAGKYTGLRSSDSKILASIEQSPLRKKIHVLGEVSKNDLSSLYASAKALIFPSLYEGFGLPPLEAMASGCPVLASHAASIPEVCSDAALYFSPHSVKELATQMERILTEPGLSLQFIQRGFSRCRLFSWEKTADSYRCLFQNVCQV